MDERRQRLRAYRRARRKFACVVYLVSIAWMILALLQWLVVCLVKDVRNAFVDYYWISVIFFVLAMALVTFFIFFEKIRFIMGVNWLICVLIVEFVTIGLFSFVAHTLWPDLLMWFAVCVLLAFLFILFGSIIPHDLTLDVVILFVLAFIFLIVTVFFIMMHVVVGMPYAFIAYQIFITVIVLLFVMYHAQTINGGRFAEMRLDDYLLASLILFHDFVVIFMLTFYAQITYKLASEGMSTTVLPNVTTPVTTIGLTNAPTTTPATTTAKPA
ncbi:protein lifeguard 2 [Drosophila tropicalis]|uniref:protein lifeguard 2 n=1 Tax=Drosophila tropicalis TaxID=46794 RepID=UPI0035ABDDF3